jgi:DnaK suppressor protein
MTQDEADKLMREVEASHAKRKPFTPPPVAVKPAPKVEAPHAYTAHHSTPHSAPAAKHAPAPIKHAAKPAAKHTGAAKKPAAKKTTMKPAAKKHSVKSATKSKPKASGKTAKRR